MGCDIDCVIAGDVAVVFDQRQLHIIRLSIQLVAGIHRNFVLYKLLRLPLPRNHFIDSSSIVCSRNFCLALFRIIHSRFQTASYINCCNVVLQVHSAATAAHSVNILTP